MGRVPHGDICCMCDTDKDYQQQAYKEQGSHRVSSSSPAHRKHKSHVRSCSSSSASGKVGRVVSILTASSASMACNNPKRWLEFLLSVITMLIVIRVSPSDWRSSARIASRGSTGCAMGVKLLYWRAAHHCS